MPRRSRLQLLRAGSLSLLVLGLTAFAWSFGLQHVTAQASPTVQTRTAGSIGTVLVGSDGKTLYVFDRDTPGVSTCTGDCASTWPPLELASGNPVAPAGVGGQLAAIMRADGKRQVTYNDHPLYRFAADAQPGDTKGDGVGGVWHAAKPVAAAAAAASPASGAAARVTAMPATGSGGGTADSAKWLAMALLLGASTFGAVSLLCVRFARERGK